MMIQRNTMFRLLGILAVCITISSCKKTESDPAPAAPATNTPTQAEYHFAGFFADSAIAYQQADGYYQMLTGRTVTSQRDNTDNIYDAFFIHGTSWGTKKYTLTYYKQKLDVDNMHYLFTEDDFKTVFPLGNSTQFTVYDESTNIGTDGWEIIFMDKGETYWSSSTGGSQTGSFVKIDSKTPVTVNGGKYFKLQGSFSCKLYNEDGKAKTFKGTFTQMVIAEDLVN